MLERLLEGYTSTTLDGRQLGEDRISPMIYAQDYSGNPREKSKLENMNIVMSMPFLAILRFWLAGALGKPSFTASSNVAADYRHNSPCFSVSAIVRQYIY